jgi:hypothetical protein
MPTEQQQINALRDVIKEKAFKAKSITIKTQLRPDEKGRLRLDTSQPARETSFSVITGMKVYRQGAYRQKELFTKTEDLAAVAEWNEIINSFLTALVDEIWEFKKRNYYIKKTLEDDLMEQIRPFVRGLETSGDVKVALKAIGTILKQNVEFSKTRDYKYFYETKPNAHDRKIVENEVLDKIRKLYVRLYKQDAFPLKRLSQTTSEANMAIVFAAVDFWLYEPKTKVEKDAVTELESRRAHVRSRRRSIPQEEIDSLKQKSREIEDSIFELKAKLYAARLDKRFRVIDRGR